MMETKLRELMLEAGYAAPELAGRALKLADLIVQECARMCYNKAVEQADIDTVKSGHKEEALMSAYNAINDYFGVKK